MPHAVEDIEELKVPEEVLSKEAGANRQLPKAPNNHTSKGILSQGRLEGGYLVVAQASDRRT